MEDLTYHAADLVQRLAVLSKQRPQGLAAQIDSSSLTFQALNEASERLAVVLIRAGIKKGDTVGVCLAPSCEILIAMFAIFRLGAVYMPLNPDHPKHHHDLIILDAQPATVITSRLLNQRGLFAEVQQIFVDDPLPDSRADAIALAPDDPAYLMFTSGTTGRPKGVLLSNQNLAHYLGEAHRLLDIRADDVFCNLARLTFSISLFDLLLPMTFGASVRLVSRDKVIDFEALLGELKRSTVLHAGPALLTALFRFLSDTKREQELMHMQHVSTGGDIVLPVVMDNMKRFFPVAELFVFYGCTEIACMGTYFMFANAKRTPVGKRLPLVPLALDRTYVGCPFPQMDVMLVDEDLSPVAAGQVGEICFRGPGLALAYLNQPELTQERFPRWSKDPQLPQQRLYRTGDFGRWQMAGMLEILGRRDFQVQIRGARVELSAIENCIIELGLAHQCIVVKRTIACSQREGRQAEDAEVLVGFLVSRQPASERKKSQDIAQMLERYLPHEMIPSVFHYLESLPCNFNGKLDRKQLQTMDLSSRNQDETVWTPTEKIVIDVFKQQLNLDCIDRQDHFFTIGGHSLMAIIVVSKLRHTYGMDLSVADFFLHPTAASLAAFWDQRKAHPLPAKRPCTALPLQVSSSQKPKIFLLAGANIYRQLAAALAVDWSVYALVSEKEVCPCDPATETRPFTIEELADDYLEAILAEQPEGPYTIFGHSFGGVIAYQLAQKIEQRGLQVKHLILVDALLPEWAQNLRFRAMQVLRIFRSHPVDLWRFFCRKWREGSLFGPRDVPPSSSGSLSSEQVDRSSMTSYVGVLADMDEARVRLKRDAAVAFMKRIKPGFSSATLFLSRVRFHQNPLHSKTLTWNRYIKRLNVVWLDVGHSAMIQDPYAVRDIAATIKESARSLNVP